MNKIKATAAVKTIMRDLNDVDFNILFSWGIDPCKSRLTIHGGNYGISVYVNGFFHKGYISIILNGITELYYIVIDDIIVKNNITSKILGSVLDELIEKPHNMTDEEYKELITNTYKLNIL